MESKRVGLDAVPGQVQATRPRFLRADSVLPFEAGDKVSPGVTKDRHAELAHEFDDISAKSFFVGGGVLGVVDAAVYPAPHVLNEPPEESAVNGSNRLGTVDGNGGNGGVHGIGPPRQCSFGAQLLTGQN